MIYSQSRLQTSNIYLQSSCTSPALLTTAGLSPQFRVFSTSFASTIAVKFPRKKKHLPGPKVSIYAEAGFVVAPEQTTAI